MEIRNLKAFHTITRTLNFTRAAEILGYAQSSITAQIKALESELGVRLFDRQGRGIRLTEAGRRLETHAARILAQEEQARADIKGESHQHTAINMSAAETIFTYRLPPLLAAFRAKSPQTRLIFKPAPVSDLRREIRQGELDVAFILENQVADPSLQIELLVREPVVLLCSPDHRLALSQQVHPENLFGETIFFTPLGCDYRNQFERILIREGVYPANALELSSIEAIKKCVGAGMGVTVLPKVAVEKELAQGELIDLPWQGGPIEVDTQMVYNRAREHTPDLVSFLDLARSILRV